LETNSRITTDPAADDLAALAELLAWQRAGEWRHVTLAVNCQLVYVAFFEGERIQHRDAPTLAEAVRDALAAWRDG